MTSVIFSRLAEQDLDAIAEYTQRTWGEMQAKRYVAELQHCYSSPIDPPNLGRICADIRPALRRLEKGSHVIFYR